jgi:hypothetical protein
MDVDRSNLLDGKALFITSALEKRYGEDFTHIKELATALGAHRVEVGAAKKTNGMSDRATIFLGLDHDDPDAKKLVEEDGRARDNTGCDLLLRHRLFEWMGYNEWLVGCSCSHASYSMVLPHVVGKHIFANML